MLDTQGHTFKHMTQVDAAYLRPKQCAVRWFVNVHFAKVYLSGIAVGLLLGAVKVDDQQHRPVSPTTQRPDNIGVVVLANVLT